MLKARPKLAQPLTAVLKPTDLAPGLSREAGSCLGGKPSSPNGAGSLRDLPEARSLPRLSTMQIEVCSSDTSSPTYCSITLIHSCRQTTSGLATVSQLRKFGKPWLMSLMLKVATSCCCVEMFDRAGEPTSRHNSAMMRQATCYRSSTSCATMVECAGGRRRPRV